MHMTKTLKHPLLFHFHQQSFPINHPKMEALQTLVSKLVVGHKSSCAYMVAVMRRKETHRNWFLSVENS